MMKKTLFPFFILILLVSACKTGPTPGPTPKKEIKYTYHHELRMPTDGINSETPTLLLLHGYGSNELDLASLGKYMHPKMLVVCPRAPITLTEGKYSWYPLNRTEDSWTYDGTQVMTESINLQVYIKQIIDGFGVAADKIYLGGFSQGAIMSLATGLTEPELLAGIIALSGELYPEVKSRMAPAKELQKTKLFVSHGLKDDVLFPAPMKKAVTDLKALGMNVEDHWYPVAHTISQDNYKDLLGWLLKEVESK